MSINAWIEIGVFIGGIIIGYFFQWLRYRYSSKLETHIRVSETLDKGGDLVLAMWPHIKYIKDTIGLKSRENKTISIDAQGKLIDLFDGYSDWYLESIRILELNFGGKEKPLLSSLTSLYVTISKNSINDKLIILNVKDIYSEILNCRKLISSFYKKR